MDIHGVTVCVDYADLLVRGLSRWLSGLTTLTVVTTPDDAHTLKLVEGLAVRTWRTEVFYADGAAFNKGAALSEAFEAVVPWKDWIALIDADIVPPRNWKQILEQEQPQPGHLYGAHRVLENGRRYHDGEIAGFFQLFHTSDPHVQRRPLVETNWVHAGGYDSELQFRWKPHQRVHLPIDMTHLGEPGKNWFGVGNEAEMRTMLAARRDRGVQPTERLK